MNLNFNQFKNNKFRQSLAQSKPNDKNNIHQLVMEVCYNSGEVSYIVEVINVEQNKAIIKEVFKGDQLKKAIFFFNKPQRKIKQVED